MIPLAPMKTMSMKYDVKLPDNTEKIMELNEEKLEIEKEEDLDSTFIGFEGHDFEKIIED